MKSIIVEDQEKVIDAQKRLTNKLKKENKDLKTDLKSIQKIVFKGMFDKEVLNEEENCTKTFYRDSKTGLITSN